MKGQMFFVARYLFIIIIYSTFSVICLQFGWRHGSVVRTLVFGWQTFLIYG